MLSGLIFGSALAAQAAAFSDGSLDVSADGLGNVYISGLTDGSLGGANAGGIDAFVSKYDAAGSLQWTRQLGSPNEDISRGVSADALGNVYISGSTRGSLVGSSAGSIDAFVGQYDAAGNLQWTKQLGTSTADSSTSVSADGLGNVYLTGYTGGSLGGPFMGRSDAFVSKYDAAGNYLWTRQLGTSNFDYGYDVSADGLGYVYISGKTDGSLNGPSAGRDDAFVSKYDAAGNLQWTRQLGSSENDGSNGVSADGLGNVYISGSTRGSLGGPSAGDDDAFVSKYDAEGNLQWTRQLGTSRIDHSLGVSADALGNVFISGSIGAVQVDMAQFILRDTFVSKYDSAGNLHWTRQLGTSEEDQSYGVSADGLGNVYISGSTTGSLGGPSAGRSDAFVSKYDSAGNLQWTRQLGSVPEPVGWLLAALASTTVFRRRTRRSPSVSRGWDSFVLNDSRLIFRSVRGAA
jgi:hypothetical protein